MGHWLPNNHVAALLVKSMGIRREISVNACSVSPWHYIVLFEQQKVQSYCSRRPASSHKTHPTPPSIGWLGWFSSQCSTLTVSSHRLSVNVCLFSHVWAVVTLWPLHSFSWPAFHCSSVSRPDRWKTQASCPLPLVCHPSCPLHLTSPMPRQLRQPGGGHSVRK